METKEKNIPLPKIYFSVRLGSEKETRFCAVLTHFQLRQLKNSFLLYTFLPSAFYLADCMYCMYVYLYSGGKGTLTSAAGAKLTADPD